MLEGPNGRQAKPLAQSIAVFAQFTEMLYLFVFT